MINAPHIFETALLLLAAFLVGAVVGLLARLMARAGKKPAAVAAIEAPKPAQATGPQLVTAPTIAQLPTSRPSAAERLAAAAGKAPEELAPVETAAAPVVETAPIMPAVKMPEMAKLPEFAASAAFMPARVAGETLTGKHIDNPEHGAQTAEPVPPSTPVPESAPAVVAVAEPAPAEAAPAIEQAAEAVAEPDPLAASIEVAPVPEPAAPAELAAEPAPAAASMEDVRAELEAQIQSELMAEADEPPPVETRIEREIAAEPEVEVTDTPEEVAAEIQEVVQLAANEPIPEVIAEAPLIESSFDPEPEHAAPAPAVAVPVAEEKLPSPAAEMGAPEIDDETAAMRAIEGGWSPRKVQSRAPAPRPEGVPADVVAADDAVAASSAAVANATAMATAVLEEIAPIRTTRVAGGFGRPPGLAEPRDGRKDDFSQIKGLAPALESSLNGLGIFHYDQIADWDQKGVVWIENHFGFKGRVARERWQEQARELGRGRSVQTARPVRL